MSVKERPLLFSGPMVRALLADMKTQTRRVLKPQPISSQLWGSGVPHSLPTHFCVHARWAAPYPSALKQLDAGDPWLPCPYGKAGDRLWVKETAAHIWTDRERGWQWVYRADGLPSYLPDGETIKWRSSLFLPKGASRLKLEITEVRAERLQAISARDALAEGVHTASMREHPDLFPDPVSAYADLWDCIHGEGAWEQNLWVWALTFRRVESEVAT